AKPQDFLPDPPKGHDPLQIKDGEKGIMRRASLQAPKGTCAQVSKHFGSLIAGFSSRGVLGARLRIARH
ncbi:MAG TPA: hypothetical protein VKE72_01400, partial [Methylocella sp.]|nr:hypothetical protein [Methylocella sp.]